MTGLGELKHGIWREAYKYYKETVLVFQEKDPLTFNNRQLYWRVNAETTTDV